jgi:hypothetical protein
MNPCSRAVSLAGLSALLFLSGCNNTLNPLCGSARPAPLIGSLSPSSLTFAQVQQGATVVVNGSHFVSASEVLINSVVVSPIIVSETQMKVKVTSSLVSAPGKVDVKVSTPSGNSGDLGCSSGGTSSALVLTVN